VLLQNKNQKRLREKSAESKMRQFTGECLDQPPFQNVKNMQVIINTSKPMLTAKITNMNSSF
jgi:hypothetical protein